MHCKSRGSSEPLKGSTERNLPAQLQSGVAVVPQESYLSSTHMISCGADRRLCLWNLQLGTLVGTYTDSSGSEVWDDSYTSIFYLPSFGHLVIIESDKHEAP